jgi:hypothetical protein
MDSNLTASLLLSIEADNLALLCGAGLSMAAPSNVPSAYKVSECCAAEYKYITGTVVPPEVQGDLGKLAQFFKDGGNLTVFLDQLIPWKDFRCGRPNTGHQAVADFLAAKVLELAITTNVDTLVEEAAEDLGEQDFRAMVEANDINKQATHAPLLKLHGCAERNRSNSVWCVGQLEDASVKQSLVLFRNWLITNLHNKDLLVVGFWSDWSYLNPALQATVIGTQPQRIILVDPADPATLESKAPELWAWAHSGQVRFEHVQAKGEVFLDDLRQVFSRRFINKILTDAGPQYERLLGPCDPTLLSLPTTLSMTDLYGLRQSFCGEPVTQPPRAKRPQAGHTVVGVIHIALLARGASLEGGRYRLDDRTIRLVFGAGEFISSLKDRFSKEPPSPRQSDKTICVGATDDGGVPADIVRSAQTPNIVRSGTCGEWVTGEAFLQELWSTK